ncbi:hypothetical protein GGX14DRAFT_401075 [Mycena pura]|uniref:Uncharacterized protein n=1 Tax=Mycena pura TaxID=153505 RepID=A0AAD6V4T2_9AGAR|nr:hypothetical protein GGX14DRAFT_401075 [Mycena pura]
MIQMAIHQLIPTHEKAHFGAAPPSWILSLGREKAQFALVPPNWIPSPAGPRRIVPANHLPQYRELTTICSDSDMLWLDAHVSSTVREVKASFTSDAHTYVEHMEYLKELPTGFPVPRVSTAFVVDLSDPKFNILDNKGILLSVDVLIAGEGSSGAADPAVSVSSLDKTLLEVTRHELDAASHTAVIQAARETRRHEGETFDRLLIPCRFFDRVKSSQCKAKRADGKICSYDFARDGGDFGARAKVSIGPSLQALIHS